MTDRLSVTWRGKDYEAVRKDGREAQPEPGPVWHVTREGAPITSFPAQRAESPGDVRAKIVEWLEGNASRPSQDVGRQ